MKSMLGKIFPILEILDNGDIIALPSPDGSQDGKWYFLRMQMAQPSFRISQS